MAVQETFRSADNDVLTVIAAQHQLIREQFEQVAQALPAERDDLFCELRRMLAVHETAEEEIVYPVLRISGDEGATIADRRIREESRAKELLADLEKLGTGEPEFPTRLHALRVDVETHALREEQEVLPTLRAHQSEDRLRVMAKAFAVAEAAAPTHPHPHAPDGAVGQLLLGPFVAVADRVRDALHAHLT
jgi:hemerythrin superfamily protein